MPNPQKNKKNTNAPSKNDKVIDEIIELLTHDKDSIIKDISDGNINYQLSSQQVDNILKKIYEQKQYEEIVNKLYDLYTERATNGLPECFIKICETIKKNGSIRKKGIPQPENYLATLWQYNEASISDRIKRISETENRVNGLMSKIGKIEPKIDEKVNKSKDSIITLTVTVLGIFTSITFSLTGSLSLLSNILNESNSFAEALFKYSLIGIFVANLIFLLLYIVSKMNNKSIAMHCSLCKDISYIC